MAMFGTLSAFDPIDRKFITPQQSFTPAATPNPYNMKPAGGFFAPGGTGRSIAGSVGDALLQLGHMQPIYQPAIQAQREFAMRRQLADQERQNTLSNETALYDYKLAHPEAPQPTAEMQNFAAYQAMDPSTRAMFDQYHQGDPLVTVTLPGSRVYSGPRSGLAQALGGAGGNLDSTPTTEDGYQYTPGPGGRANQANWKALGGTGGNVSGGFPQ